MTDDLNLDSMDDKTDFDSMDDKTFAAYVAKRDAEREGGSYSPDPQDSDDAPDRQDPSSSAWAKSPWATYSPDDLDRQIEANAAATGDADTEPEPVDLTEVPTDVFEALGRLGTNRGDGQDRKLVREHGLMHLVFQGGEDDQ